MTIIENKILKDLTTFRVGGPARFFCTVTSEKELLEAFAFSKDKKIPFFILGGGSNILVSDDGFPGLVIKMEMKGIEFIDDENGNTRVSSQAGEDWDELVEKCVKKELYGMENLSYIPGTVGAAPVQNIGAYGSEVKDVINSVRVFDSVKGEFVEYKNVDCHFEYRDSFFKKNPGRFVITSVLFILKKNGSLNIEYRDLKEYFSTSGKTPALEDVRNAVIEIRKRKLPDVKEIGTAGSFFKNIIVSLEHAHTLVEKYPELPVYPINNEVVKVSLAWILDHVCGYKGMTVGNVGVYKNQSLVLVNNGNATANEIKDIAHKMAQTVHKMTGIHIEPEVQYIG